MFLITGVQVTSECVQELVDFAYAEMGSVDILVNNAAIQYVSPIEDFPIEKYQQIIALNMNSVFYASKAVFKKNERPKVRTYY